MAHKVRYSGSFVSLEGNVWRCDILQESSADFEVGELTFPADSPLVIEWAQQGKEVPVLGSTATLRVLSPEDRSYIGLYTVKPGLIRLDVYRNGALHWSGALDPEFYEEPYSRERNYTISLTFSDFGILDRLTFDRSGALTVDGYLSAALDLAGLGSLPVVRLISSQLDGETLDLGALSVSAANFYDEEGEASTWREVAEALLQPLGLRMRQRGGKICLFDCNALASLPDARQIEWVSDDQTLSADKVCNNIRVTFSPYAGDTLLDGELDYGDTADTLWTNLTNAADGALYLGGQPPAGMAVPQCYTYYLDYSEEHRREYAWDYALTGFTIFVSRDGTKMKGVSAIGASCLYFSTVPLLGGSSASGVAYGFYTGGHGPLPSGFPKLIGNSLKSHSTPMVMQSESVLLPEISSGEQARTMLRVVLPMLMDPRYNPFSEPSSGNEEGNFSRFKSRANFAFVPVSIVVRDDTGAVLCHYSNSDLLVRGAAASYVSYLKGSWVEGAPSGNAAWLAWYSPEEYADGTGLTGWQENRQLFGVPLLDAIMGPVYLSADGTKHRWTMYDSFAQQPTGQFIPYPPHGGRLEVTVCGGARIYSFGDGYTPDLSGSTFAREGLYDTIRWQLFQAPRVSVVLDGASLEAPPSEDCEYSGVADADAQEDLEISTRCGTMPQPSPTARGLFRRSSDGEALSTLVRAGREDCPEQLLIGTLYSQYASRHTVLKGTSRTDPGTVGLYTDAAQPDGVSFAIEGEVQDCIGDSGMTTYVELSQDNYTS